MKENILIIDDDISILAGFKEMFTEYGYFVETAETEKEALQKVKKRKFDIAIVDMVLKESNGLDLIDKLNQLSNEIIILALTGYPPQKYVANSLRAGALRFLTKPIEREDLISVICDELVKRENNRDLVSKKPAFPWKNIFAENPACSDTILKFVKRKVDKEVLKKVSRCEQNFECLLSDEPELCSCNYMLKDDICFIDNDTKKICPNNNQISFGYSFFCTCPVRGALKKGYKL